MRKIIRLTQVVAAMALCMESGAEGLPKNLETGNLVAWCIVPFDAAKRGPAERAEMLAELGVVRCAYDWRDNHVAEFEEEILQYRKHGIEFFAFWGGHEEAFKLFQKHGIHPQIWRTLGSPSEGTEAEKVEAAADSLEALAKRTAELGCKLGLYNHGGWGGEPANLVAVCERLRGRGYGHVGIVYNWHHGHGHIGDWAEVLELMKPHLLCLNLNGMNGGGEPKIMALGQGEHELAMLKAVVAGGYDGPLGIIDHQEHLDSKEALQDNLDGLRWLKMEMVEAGSGGERPKPKAKAVTGAAPEVAPRGDAGAVASLGAGFGKALAGGLVAGGEAGWREPPVTVECRVNLRDAKGYNILVASDTKASGAHWEIFAMDGSGKLSAYFPGATPDHVRSDAVITDGAWHAVAMQYAPDRVRLWLDGKVVADAAISLKPDRAAVPGGLGMGRLVEGGLGMRGVIDEVRIRQGIREDLAKVADVPFGREGEGVLGYWDFEELEEVAAEAAVFSPDKKPLDISSNPAWQEPINRDRIYDFYAKQALHFGAAGGNAEILPEFPGLDGGAMGHWGNQNDESPWKDGRVREMDHGAMVSGVFRGAGRTIPRAVSVRLGDGYNAVFDEETLRFEVAWKGALVKWSDVRRGFMHGIPMGGDEVVPVEQVPKAAQGARYEGLWRVGETVAFVYTEGGERKVRTAAVADGKVVESLVAEPGPGEPQWKDRVTTRGTRGEGQPYAIDTLTLPHENPWKALFFVSGVDFLSESRIAVCTIHGDVWICDVSGDDLGELRWKRFAAGLHQPLGLKVADGVVHVMCRDQIVALHDGNGDDEADYYACVSGAHETSAGGHDFITGLERDDQGRWYFASGNQGLCRVSADGREAEVLATGFRNPNGLGVSPDGGVILTSVQEGNWTPASAVCEVVAGGHYGAGGPKEGELGYVAPMLYLPRGVDNSSGGQAFIDSGRWGPVEGRWIHFSHGLGTHFLVLREEIGGRSQAAAVPLWGEFLSGAHRGRFSPYDGQLYVVGSQGWGCYAKDDGSLQRVRYTGGSYPYPVGFETRENGILLTFADAQATEIGEAKLWFAQQWNYLYGPGYGSSEYSVTHPGKAGHDRLEIRSVHRLGDGTRVFLEIPQLRPVHQIHLHFGGTRGIELFATLHQLGSPFGDFPGYRRIEKASFAAGAVPDEGLSPAALFNACTACHHATQRVVGPPLAEIRARYAGNPEGIVKWAMKPENKNPQLPPMPSFESLGEARLRVIADQILGGK